jgi:N6-adenosine-specific RNA methylase IME4
MELPHKKYKIIYADPPWDFSSRPAKNRANVKDHYPTMSINEIESLPISTIADENCVLLMWTTYPALEKSFSVIKAWGFTYKTVAFTWIKKNKDNSNFMGLGYYTRSNAEIVLLATKGKPLHRESHGVRQVVEDRVGKHSKKPIIIRDKIVELFGDIPRIELFAREKAVGWDNWGNEIKS